MERVVTFGRMGVRVVRVPIVGWRKAEVRFPVCPRFGPRRSRTRWPAPAEIVGKRIDVGALLLGLDSGVAGYDVGNSVPNTVMLTT